MTFHRWFQWDKAKAAKNLKKHGVSFREAQRVLEDPEADHYHVEEYDEEHSVEEDRFITTGCMPKYRDIVLRIGWTSRSTGKKEETRIITARAATRVEVELYAEEIGKRLRPTNKNRAPKREI